MEPNSHLTAETVPAAEEENKNHLAAIKMIPPEEFDSVLAPSEIEMRFGSPVIYQGTDFSKMSKFYLQAVHDKPEDAEYREWQSIPLSDYARRAESSTMEYCQRLLAICHSLKRENVRKKEIYELLQEYHGYTSTDRTLNRQLAHAKMGLVLAAAGKIDLLPSQNAAAVITSKMPRFAWSAFLERYQIKEREAGSLIKKIEVFAEKNGITLCGHPVGCKKVDLLSLKPPSTQPTPPETDTEVEETERMPSSAPSGRKQIPIQKLSMRVALRLHKCVPTCHLGNPVEVSRNLLKELKGAQDRVPRPARHAMLDLLAEEMAQLDSVRAAAINQAALRLFYGQALDKATRRRKKVKADTPCPKS